MESDLKGVKVSHTERMNYGELSAYYHLDVSELEFRDTTAKHAETDSKAIYNEQGVPVYQGYKFRVMKQIKPTNQMSSAWFHYETSPIKIRYNIDYRPFSDFLVHLCAILGGMFAAAGVISGTISTLTGLCSSEKEVKISAA